MSDGPCANERAAHALVHTILSSDPEDLARHLAFIHIGSEDREAFERKFLLLAAGHLSATEISDLYWADSEAQVSDAIKGFKKLRRYREAAQ